MQTSFMKTEPNQKSVLPPSVQAVFDREAQQRLERTIDALECENQRLRAQVQQCQLSGVWPLNSSAKVSSVGKECQKLRYQLMVGAVGLAAYLTFVVLMTQ